MRSISLVFLFGGIGSVLRYLGGVVAIRAFGADFPWGTLAINIIGCTLIGIFARIIPLPSEGGEDLRLICMTGLCGGFTTFSAFALETAHLWMRDVPAAAAAYVAASVLLCLIGVSMGLAIGKAIIS
jgi:CrcB protein